MIYIYICVRSIKLLLKMLNRVHPSLLNNFIDLTPKFLFGSGSGFDCTSCQFYEETTKKCKLFDINIIISRLSENKCGINAKEYIPKNWRIN